MRKLSAMTAAAMLYATTALAAPITGELSLNGSDTFTATATSFTITFLNPANIGGTSGSFQTALGPVPPAIDNVVTMIASLSDTTAAGFQLYSATVGAITTTLTAGTISSFTFTPGTPLESLAVSGAGVLSLTGFDPTPGNFDITTQGPTGQIANVTFSSTQIASAVSEPGSLAVFAAALLSLGWVYNRRRRNDL